LQYFSYDNFGDHFAGEVQQMSKVLQIGREKADEQKYSTR
jgi:hypothetical protein